MLWIYLLIIVGFSSYNIEASGVSNRCGQIAPINGDVIKLTQTLYMYTCKPGYQLVGETYRKCTVNREWVPQEEPKCEDKNECQAAGYVCNNNADCINTIGSYECICKSGYTGNGYQCHPEQNRFTNDLREDDNCGFRSAKFNHTGRRFRRIIGGQNSQPGKWPWMALITVNGGPVPLFGGVLIKPGWILTIASLLHKSDKELVKEEDILVSLGEYDINRPSSEEQQIRIKHGGIHVYHKFDRRNMKNDIALLELETEADITDYVNTICLVGRKKSRKFERGRHLASVAGWGLTKPLKLHDLETSKPLLYSGTLKDISIPVIGPYKCRTSTSYHFHKKTMLCAGVLNGEAAPCIGDGGSPLMIEDPATKRWLLLGLFSWSEGCGQPSKYSYFTRVVRFSHWIENITKLKRSSHNNDI